jgi:phage baseplate assembly protein W
MASNREYDNDPDVFIGVKLPIEYGTSGFFNKTSTTIEQAEYNLKNLLLTKFGERFGHPTFGCSLSQLNFEQMDDDILVKSEESINEAVSKWLPYIKINNISPSLNKDLNRLNIKIHFSLVTDPTQSNTTVVTYNQ